MLKIHRYIVLAVSREQHSLKDSCLPVAPSFRKLPLCGVGGGNLLLEIIVMPAIHRHEFCHKRLHDQIFNARNFTQQTRVNRDYLYNTVKQCNCMNISNLGTFTAHHVYSCTGWRILLWSCCWWKMYGVKSKFGHI